MLDLTVEFDFDDVIDEMDDLVKRQIPYAAQQSLNETVFKASLYLKKVMPFFIEGGPIGFTKSGFQYRKAKSKHAPVAYVIIEEKRWKYMRWVVDGGQKRWAMSKHGISMPIYANNRFNKYGNIPGKRRKEGIWRDMLNQASGQDMAPRGKMGAKQFVAEINGQKGIWKRMGKGGKKVKLLMLFTHDAVSYRQSVPFTKNTVMFVDKYYPKAFDRHLTKIVNRENEKLRAR